MKLLALVGLAIAATASGCEVFRLVNGEYGAIRGTIVETTGEPVTIADVVSTGEGHSRAGSFSGSLVEDDADEGSNNTAWHDFGDGRGRTLVRVVPAFEDLNEGWLLGAGRPSHYYLREGAFVIDHVRAGQREVMVDATLFWSEQLSATSSVTHNFDTRVVVPVNVKPDQWTDVRIVVPAPTPTPPPSQNKERGSE